MKKYILFLAVFIFTIGLFSFNVNSADAANCAPGDLFSSTTGQPCSTNTTTVDGCMAGYLFSATTGKPCPTEEQDRRSTITVLSPNGGENWVRDNQQTIYWQDNRVAQYNVFLINENQQQYTLARNVYSSSSNHQGSYGWQVGLLPFNNSIAPYGPYKVKVCRISPVVNCDSSNAVFFITSALSITTPSPLPNGRVGDNSYQVILRVLPDSMPTNQLFWSVINGSLPPGLSLSASDLGQIITGTPTVAGTYNFTLRASTPATQQVTTKQFTLTIDPATTTTPIGSLSMSPNGGTIKAGETITLQALFDNCPSGSQCFVGPRPVQAVSWTWESSGPGNPPVSMTISNDRLSAIITGLSEGTAIIIARYLDSGNEFTAGALVTVRKTTTTVDDGAVLGAEYVPGCFSLQNNLRYKDRDSRKNGEVTILQNFLGSQGYFNHVSTGYFGILTLKAVKDFQKANTISPTGYVGPITRAKIRDLTCGTTPPIIIPPVSQSSVTVLNPNGGESWQKGKTYTINWQDNTPIPPCPAGTGCVKPAPKSYDIQLKESCITSKNSGCATSGGEVRTIKTGVSGSSYQWTIPNCTVSNPCSSNFEIAEGSYIVQVCQTGSKVCDSSDHSFNIVTAGQQPTTTGSLSISPTNATVRVGDTATLQAMFDNCPSGSQCFTPPMPVQATWTSSNPQVASVTYKDTCPPGANCLLYQPDYKTAEVMGLAQGTSTITATYQGSTDKVLTSSVPVAVNVVTTTPQAPTISSLSPSSGVVGASVTITGTRFTSTNNSVKFGGGYINGLSSNGTQITFTIPEGMTPCPPSANVCAQSYMQVTPGTYPVSVMNSNGTSNSMSFVVNPIIVVVPVPPTITSLSPVVTSVGSQVTLRGTGFTATGNRVNFRANFGSSWDTSGASYNSVDGTTLIFTVPASLSGAFHVDISVTNANGTSNIPSAFFKVS